ncbi:MAG: helix-turn-helix transcriptional regulator, partial [Parvularculaceae bacterium]|nr:helix-turn-helix transcriptional regulator [Parvularculaceae bacterium]
NMAEGGVSRDEPVREVMALIGDRWSTLILLILEAGATRHAALRRLINRLSSEGAISQRVLTAKLRALERDGFVIRSATHDIPPRVDYALSPLGAELVERIHGFIDWIRGNRDQIETARELTKE